MARFPHSLRITRPGEGGTTGPNGVWVPGEPTVVYDGLADVQDAGEAVPLADDGTPTLDSDAVAYLATRTAAASVRPGDDAEVTWEDGSTAAAAVERVRRLDGVLGLRWV